MRMTATQRVDLWFRQATPIALTVLLAVLSAVPIGVPGYSAVVPGYTAMAAFYWAVFRPDLQPPRSEEHTSELQSLMRISYAVFCLQKNKLPNNWLQSCHVHGKHPTDHDRIRRRGS